MHPTPLFSPNVQTIIIFAAAPSIAIAALAVANFCRLASCAQTQVRAARAACATQNLATGAMSTSAYSAYQCIQTEPAIVAGAAATLNSIRSAWSMQRPPPRTRTSEATGALTRTDAKRRKPD